MKLYNAFVYITTKPSRTTLYVGVTSDLEGRIYEHYENKGNKATFAGRYYCYNLIYYEWFSSIEHAIEREKEIKKWRREKKVQLINSFNKEWKFLNDIVCDL